EVPGLFGDEARARRLDRAISAIAGVTGVRADPRTGRVLILLSGGDAAALVREAARAEADPLGAPAPSVRRTLARWRDLARGALRVVRRGMRRAEGELPEGGEEAEPAPPFHAWEVPEVARELGVDPAIGLDDAEAGRRLRAWGPNV